MIYIGIDPGVNGGIAVLGDKRRPDYQDQASYDFHVRVIDVRPMPDSLDKIWSMLRLYEEGRYGATVDYPVALIEKVGGYISPREGQDRENRQPGSHMFNFGRICGCLETCLLAIGLSEANGTLLQETPRQWQKALGVPKRKPNMTDHLWKKVLQRHAAKLFPRNLVQLQTADALLLAFRCREIQYVKSMETSRALDTIFPARSNH